METSDKIGTGIDSIRAQSVTTVPAPGIDLHPSHASWARISMSATASGCAIAMVLGVVFIVLIATHFHPVAIAAMVVAMVGSFALLLGKKSRKSRTAFLGDAGLTARIKADLITELGANSVEVISKKGVVTLRGSMPFPNFCSAAEQLAQRGGAHQVINELTVNAAPPGPPDTYMDGLPGVTTLEGAPEVETSLPLDEAVRKALAADPRVHANILMVSVEEGIVYLTGRQETVQASSAATEIAAHVPGVLGVSNDLEILPSY